MMHTYYDLKDMLHKELEQIAKKGELSAGSLETIDKLLNSIKNAHKIIMYEEFGGDGYSRADGMNMSDHSYADRRRDSLGRYSSRMMRDDGYSRTGYSYHDGKSEKVEILRDMMKDVSDDERRVISKLIRRMENE